IVLFRNSFEHLYSDLPSFGPQDLEQALISSDMPYSVEAFICRLLSQTLNRKKPVEVGRFGRAMEEVINVHISEIPEDWRGINPLSGGISFKMLELKYKLSILKSLVYWALGSSEQIKSVVAEAYVGNRDGDDSNCFLSVKPIGEDKLRRRYHLIQGTDDTRFRICRQIMKWKLPSDGNGKFSELWEDWDYIWHAQEAKLKNELSRLCITLEESELRRLKRDHKEQRRKLLEAQGLGAGSVGLYEGRTRGRRIDYRNDGVASADANYLLDDDSYRDDHGKNNGSAGSNRGYTTASGRVSRRPGLRSKTATSDVDTGAEDDPIEGFPSGYDEREDFGHGENDSMSNYNYSEEDEEDDQEWAQTDNSGSLKEIIMGLPSSNVIA
ncbi:uncharacterized protein V1510DRAFT_369953, partial [Dipodascopsis tothii]|uniref:uncharacterized protein n=1 Tax=Dipodascopsis tothii TaxID=44089 RepID=UPI0034CDFF29